MLWVIIAYVLGFCSFPAYRYYRRRGLLQRGDIFISFLIGLFLPWICLIKVIVFVLVKLEKKNVQTSSNSIAHIRDEMRDNPARPLLQNPGWHVTPVRDDHLGPDDRQVVPERLEETRR